jgi:hypothetical protein
VHSLSKLISVRAATRQEKGLSINGAQRDCGALPDCRVDIQDRDLRAPLEQAIGDGRPIARALPVTIAASPTSRSGQTRLLLASNFCFLLYEAQT